MLVCKSCNILLLLTSKYVPTMSFYSFYQNSNWYNLHEKDTIFRKFQNSINCDKFLKTEYLKAQGQEPGEDSSLKCRSKKILIWITWRMRKLTNFIVYNLKPIRSGGNKLAIGDDRWEWYSFNSSPHLFCNGIGKNM